MDEALVTQGWQDRADQLAELLRIGNRHSFAEWGVVRRGMTIGETQHVLRQLRYLQSLRDWDMRWKPAIRETDVGGHRRCRSYRESSGTLIRHAYYLAQTETLTGIKANGYDFVFEFGGGYGSLCRLFHNLGFKGKYLLYELEPFCELQRYFLGALGLPVCNAREFAASEPCILSVSDFDVLTELLRWAEHKRAMFIATWSLSETPQLTRMKILPLVENFEAYLLIYQRVFEGINNQHEFGIWSRSLAQTDWRCWEVEGNADCLVGWNRRAA
jgi:hypothetical protein